MDDLGGKTTTFFLETPTYSIRFIEVFLKHPNANIGTGFFFQLQEFYCQFVSPV